MTEAYGQLAAEGYLAMSQGAPVRVAKAVRTANPRPPARSLLESFAYHFHPGLPDLAAFRARPGCARCAQRCAAHRWRASATATPAACRSCAKPSATTSAACAAWTQTPSTR